MELITIYHPRGLEKFGCHDKIYLILVLYKALFQSYDLLYKALFQSYDLLHRQLNGSQFSIVLPLYSVSNDCSPSIPPVNHVTPPKILTPPVVMK